MVQAVPPAAREHKAALALRAGMVARSTTQFRTLPRVVTPSPASVVVAATAELAVPVEKVAPEEPAAPVATAQYARVTLADQETVVPVALAAQAARVVTVGPAATAELAETAATSLSVTRKASSTSRPTTA